MVERQNGILRSLRQELKNIRQLGDQKQKVEVEKQINKLEKNIEKEEIKKRMNLLEHNIQKNINHQLNEYFNPYNHCNIIFLYFYFAFIRKIYFNF